MDLLADILNSPEVASGNIFIEEASIALDRALLAHETAQKLDELDSRLRECRIAANVDKRGVTGSLVDYYVEEGESEKKADSGKGGIWKAICAFFRRIGEFFTGKEADRLINEAKKSNEEIEVPKGIAKVIADIKQFFHKVGAWISDHKFESILGAATILAALTAGGFVYFKRKKSGNEDSSSGDDGGEDKGSTQVEKITTSQAATLMIETQGAMDACNTALAKIENGSGELTTTNAPSKDNSNNDNSNSDDNVKADPEGFVRKHIKEIGNWLKHIWDGLASRIRGKKNDPDPGKVKSSDNNKDETGDDSKPEKVEGEVVDNDDNKKDTEESADMEDWDLEQLLATF